MTSHDIAAQDFPGLELNEPICRALRAGNYASLTLIQARAIPPLLAGRDLLDVAQTGTGKTASGGDAALPDGRGAWSIATPHGTRSEFARERSLNAQIQKKIEAKGPTSRPAHAGLVFAG